MPKKDDTHPLEIDSKVSLSQRISCLSIENSIFQFGTTVGHTMPPSLMEEIEEFEKDKVENEKENPLQKSDKKNFEIKVIGPEMIEGREKEKEKIEVIETEKIEVKETEKIEVKETKSEEKPKEEKDKNEIIILERAYKKGNYLNENFDDIWGKSQKIYFKEAAVIEPQTESTKMFQKLIKNIDKVGVLNKKKWERKEKELKIQEEMSQGFWEKVLNVFLGNSEQSKISRHSKRILEEKRMKVLKKENQQKQYENSATFNLFRNNKI